MCHWAYYPNTPATESFQVPKMWKAIAVALCACVLTVSAHMSGGGLGNSWGNMYTGMGGGMGHSMGSGNSGGRGNTGGSGHVQGNSNSGMGNVFGSLIGAFLASALTGGRQQQQQPQMMMPQMMMPQMWPMMMHKMMMGNDGQGQNQGQGHDMMGMGWDGEKLKEMMHYAMIEELYESLKIYGDFKKAKASYEEVMEALCFMLAVNTQHAIETNQTWAETNDNTLDDLKDMMQDWEGDAIWAYLKDMLSTNEVKFYEVFFRLADVGCKAGKAVKEAYEKLEDAKRDE